MNNDCQTFQLLNVFITTVWFYVQTVILVTLNNTILVITVKLYVQCLHTKCIISVELYFQSVQLLSN